MKVIAPPKLSFLLFLGSSFLQAGFYWGLTIFISRNFSSQELGSYSYLLAFITPLFVLSSLQARSFLLTNETYSLAGELKWLRILFPTLLFLAGLFFVASQSSSPLTYILIALLKMGELWSDLSYGMWQFQGKLHRVNQSLVLRYFSLFVMLFIASLLNTGLEELLTALACGSLFVGITDHFLSGLSKVPVKIKGSKRVFATTLSLSASALLTALLVNIPRYQLKSYHSVESVGEFTLIFYYYVLPSMLLNYACQGMLKEFKGLFAERKVFYRYLGLVMVATILYAAFLALTGNQLNKLVYARTILWNGRIILLIFLSVLTGSISSLLHYILMSRNTYHVQLLTNIASSLTTFVAGMILIPANGVMGALMSFIAGLLIQLTIYLITFFKMRT